MRSLPAALLLATVIGSGAMAQTTTTGTPAAPDAKTSQQSGGQESVTRPNTDKATPQGMPAGAHTNAKLERGANSFTEGEVRSGWRRRASPTRRTSRRTTTAFGAARPCTAASP